MTFLFKYRAVAGAGSKTHTPSLFRTNSALVQYKISGASGANLQVHLEGRLNDSAPWAKIGDTAIGSWDTAGSGESKAQSSGSYSVEVAAHPEMRVRIATYSVGSSGAVRAESAIAAIALSGTKSPERGAFVQLEDAFGHKVRIYSTGIGQTADPSWRYHFTPVAGDTNEGIEANRDAIVDAINAGPRADGRILIRASNGSSQERVALQHDVPGTTGNSTVVTVSGTGWIKGQDLTGGAGTDTYVSAWIDSNV